MKRILLTLATLGLLAAASVQAAVTNYPALNVSYSTPGSTETHLTTGLVNIDPAHVFLDSNGGSGTADPVLSRYYAGTITMGGSITPWHSYAQVKFFSAADANLFQVGVGPGANKIQIHREAWNNTFNVTPDVTTGVFHFQIKVEDKAWGGNIIKFFWGANAIAETEGTPDLVWDDPGAGSWIGDSIAKMSVTFDASGFASAFSFATTDISSDTAWIAPAPVAQVSTLILPAGGNFTGPQSVNISAIPPSATIHYTLDGSTPTTSSPVYTGPLTISSNTTVKALGVKSGLTDSAVMTENYLIAVTTPSFTPGAGTYNITNLSVTLIAVPTNAAIYYTTDLSTPDNVGNGTLYTGPIPVSVDTTIKAIGYAAGLEASAVSQAFYHLEAAAPVFTPPPATYVSSQSVTLTAVPTNATIYYTTDLSSPDNITGTLYTGPITVGAGTTYLRAIAYADGLAASPVALATYVVNTNIILQWSAYAGNGSANVTETTTSVSPDLASSSATMTRGSGYPIGAYAWNPGNLFSSQIEHWPVNLAAAVSNNVYAQVVITPNAGKNFSLSSIGFLAMDAFTASTAELLYSTDGFATPGTSLLAGSASGGAGAFNTVNVSAITALQNAAGPVTFRVYFHGSATGYDVVGLGGSVGNVNPAFSFEGTIGTAVIPSAPQLTATSLGGNFSLSFASQSGASYTLQGSTNLTAWSAVTNWTGTGGTILYSVPLGSAPKEFYRIVIP